MTDEGIGPVFPDGEVQEDPQERERIDSLALLARDIVLVLVKTLKATRMYLPNNPIYQRFHEELASKFAAFFEHEDYLSFRVKQFELSFMDRQVYENPDKEDNIALMFFKDGVREFSFHKGIPHEEIEWFMDILKVDVKDRELDDDLVTLMWEKDFHHFTYTATDELTEEESVEEEALLGAAEQEKEIFTSDIPEMLGALGAASGAGAAAGLDGLSGMGGAADWTMAAVVAAGLAGEAGEVEEEEPRRGSFKAPDDLSLLMELADIFYEILITETDDERSEMVAESLSRSLDIFVNRGDLALATILVMKLQQLAEAEQLSKRSADMLGMIIEKAGSQELVGKVGAFIDAGSQDALESAGSYLRQLDYRAIDSMIRLLETLENRKARRLVCDILSELCSENGSLLAPHLSNGLWYVVRNVAMVMGKVSDPQTLPQLGRALSHEDERVRREALTAVAGMKTDEAVAVMLRHLDDPDKHTRMAAAKGLAEQSPDRAWEALIAVAESAGFEARDDREKREVFELIGRCGGEKALQFFVSRFTKKGFFLSSRKDSDRALAAYGLAAVGGDEARALLMSETGSKSSELSRACQAGLRLLDG